jgi:hypothetical protein
MHSTYFYSLVGIVAGVFIISGPVDCLAQKGDKTMQNSSSNIIITKDFEGVVFDAKKKAFWWELQKTISYWTPGTAEIIQAESLIASYFKEHAPAIYNKLKTYKRQYSGVVIEEKRCVFANFFCKDHGREWKKDEIIVQDGGDCYFQITVDLTLKRCFNLHVNGEA